MTLQKLSPYLNTTKQSVLNIFILLDNELGLFLPKKGLYENVEKIGQLSFKPPVFFDSGFRRNGTVVIFAVPRGHCSYLLNIRNSISLDL